MGSNEISPAYGDKEIVLVTGFGPFGVHKTNASNECVKQLQVLDLEEEFGIQLVCKEVPVIYDHVRDNIPRMWQLYKPKVLTICIYLIYNCIFQVFKSICSSYSWWCMLEFQV